MRRFWRIVQETGRVGAWRNFRRARPKAPDILLSAVAVRK